MFDEKLYSLTVFNAKESNRRAEAASNSANSNVVKWGHSIVRARFSNAAFSPSVSNRPTECVEFLKNFSELYSHK